MSDKERIFAVYKQKGPTSFDIVARVRKITGEKTVGHAGTLDPLASGVLVIGVGRAATRKLGEIVGQEKEYLVTIKLGETSTTDDAEGERSAVQVDAPPTAEQAARVVKSFVGEIEQTPPQFSAVKVGGKRAYRLARRGEKIELQPRKVLIKNIKVISYEFPVLRLCVVTGKGVYIRSLARDIGEKLKTGGYVLELERTRVGEFTCEEALTLEELAVVAASEKD